jgi:hypothetical protein
VPTADPPEEPRATGTLDSGYWVDRDHAYWGIVTGIDRGWRMDRARWPASGETGPA